MNAVVVGVDGSASSWQAVHVAAWEAQQRRLPLRLVNGYAREYRYLWYGLTPPFAAVSYDAEPGARAVLDQWAERVRGAYAALTVDARLSPESGARALIDASTDAALVVVGARGHGGFAGLSIGSVAAQTAAHASAPVLVVRPPVTDPDTDDVPPGPVHPVPHPGPVVVGIDGSPRSEETIAFAFDAATARGVPLVALYVWSNLPPDNLGPDRPGHHDYGDARDEAQRLLAELMAGWLTTYPDVTVEHRPVMGLDPSHELIRASHDAGLVVVGSRGRGGFTGLLLGSAGRDLIGHAESPVAIVRPSTTDVD